jgi:hypothetical protein
MVPASRFAGCVGILVVLGLVVGNGSVKAGSSASARDGVSPTRAPMLTSVLSAQARSLANQRDASGEFLWAKGMRGTSNDGGWSIALDSDGNVYTTGYFRGTVDFDPGTSTYNLTSAGDLDIFVSKLDSSGNFLWAKRIGGTDSDRGNGIAVDSLGNVYTTGFFYDIVDFDPGPGEYLLGSEDSFSDVFVSKLDTYGNFVWAMRMVGAYGGGVWDEGWSIAVGSGFNVYITGGFTFGDNIGVFQDIFVAKLDSGGHLVWGKRMGGPRDNAEFEYGYGIAVDSDGNVYTTGYLNSGNPEFGTFYPTDAAQSADSSMSQLSSGGGIPAIITVDSFDIFVSKLNSGGDFLWTKILGGTSHDKGYGIAVDSLGNVYTTGSFGGTVDFDPGPGTFNLTTAGALDIFVSKLDSNGSFVWGKRMGWANSDEGHAIALDSDRNVHTTGSFQGTPDFDPGPGTSILTSAGGLDIFVSKLDSTGNFVGAKSMGGTSSDEGWGIALDSTGNIHTTGRFAGTADFDPGVGVANLISAGSYDIFVSRLTNGLEPIITWANPAAIVFGTALSPTQLNATASFGGAAIGGTFVYTPPTGTVLTVGTRTLSTLFTPTDTGTYATATKTVTINVTNSAGAPAFTDNPLTAGTTNIRRVHITELRQAIEALRTRYTLGTFAWTDASLVTGVTPVKAAHLTELRTALNAVYAATGPPPPAYTHATITGGTTVITAVDIAELRAAILAVW